ncbi:MAG TPA: RluA family pseudouridine synthase [Actinomycetota bacterium]|nr:RluA family pseudouridine synthase [Actinomycetota bacterium]
MTRFRGRATPGRLDAVLAALAGLPRAEVQRAITDGMVTVDGRSRPKSFRLQGGEEIEAEFGRDLPAEPGGIPVRYEDQHLAVVAKPAGMVTHPTPARRTGTLVNRLLGMGMALSRGTEEDRPGIVHRLDAGTSGLLIVAKDDEAHRALTAMLAERRIARTYLALVRGHVTPDRFTIEAPLGRRGARVAVRRIAGVPAATDIEVRRRLHDATLVEARPRTGRTHQIRVHLSSMGHPIIGDRSYGGGGDGARRVGLSRPFLHSWRLAFDHPMTGHRIEIEEPLPDELTTALKQTEVGRSAHRER